MPKRILIIDDEVSIQESLSGILQDEGFLPLCASSAEAGIELLEQEQADLVLLDIWMGKHMDGMTALEIIKDRFSLPVIMISGHGTIETAVQAPVKGLMILLKNRSPTTRSFWPSTTVCVMPSLSRKTAFSRKTTASPPP